MNTMDKIFVRCDEPDGIWRATGDINPSIPQPERFRFRAIIAVLFTTHGVNGMYERLNGKSVSAILEEFGHLAHEVEQARLQRTQAKEAGERQ